jgi:hypothetical protein
VSLGIDNGQREGGLKEKMFSEEKIFQGWIMAKENVDSRK